MHPSLDFLAHRPWPLARGPWIMEQAWGNLLFAHWRVDPEILRQLVPRQLSLDLRNGDAWVAVTPFHLALRFRGLPFLPGLSHFAELNVRTYVTVDGKPGVFFFSLDASSSLAAILARSSYRLPYFPAAIEMQPRGDEVTSGEPEPKLNWVSYSCRRRIRLGRSVNSQDTAQFIGCYRPISAPALRDADSLEHWLTERYCLYATHEGRSFRAEIHHQQWPLQEADAQIELNTMASAAGISLPITPPVLHFSRRLEVLIWPLRQINIRA